MPKITVLMAAYNAESFLREAIDSVLAQTVADFEFLIFEDCSTDTTRQILKSYQDPRIKLHLNDTNQGLTKNLIRGMDLAQGEYVARMDADDVCMANRFEQQLKYFETHSEVSVLGSAVTFFDGKGDEFVGYQPTEHDEIKVTLLLGFTMLHPSVMMRKADMDQYGLNYDPEFVVSQDHDLWTRSIGKLRFANVAEPLLKMREHGGKITHTRKPKQQELSSIIRRRQLDELEVQYSQEELSAFNLGGSDISTITMEQIHALESVYLKIIKGNRLNARYEQRILQRRVAAQFRGICRQLLIEGSRVGRLFWRSGLRKYDSLTIIEYVKMVYRTLLFKQKSK